MDSIFKKGKLKLIQILIMELLTFLIGYIYITMTNLYGLKAILKSLQSRTMYGLCLKENLKNNF